MLKEFFKKPFAPFFCLAAFCATMCPMYMVCVFINDYPFENVYFTALTWHSHEMLFAFIPAVLMGFLLTAAANWTGRKMTDLRQNVLITVLWISGRVVLFSSSKVLILLVAPLFILVLLGKMLVGLRGNRNFYIVNSFIALLLTGQIFSLVSGLYDLDYQELAYTLTAAAACGFIFTFSGRLVPFFTNNRFKKPLISINRNIDIFTGIVIVLMFSFLAFDFNMGIMICSLTATLFLLYRSWCLFSKEAFKDPMILILTLAHLWLPIFTSLVFFERAYSDYAVGHLSFHALFSGALSLFVIAIMTRASLGHSGRPIKADKRVIASFSLIALGSFLRVFIPLMEQEIFSGWLHISMGIWTLGYIMFLVKFIPIFVVPRPSPKAS